MSYLILKILVLISFLNPFFIALIISIVRFKRINNRNIFIIAGLTSNIIIIIYTIFMKGSIDIQLFNVNGLLYFLLRIDKLGLLFSLMVSILWIFTSLYAMEYMKHEGKEKRFFVFFMITYGVTMGIAYSGNLFTLYFFYEFLTLATFPLVIHSGSKEAIESGKKYLVYSMGGATLVLLGMVLLFFHNPSMSFVEGGILNGSIPSNIDLLSLIYFAMFVGFGVKAAIVPFHSWLPNAMVAPTPVSALLHAVAVVKSGIFAIIRISYYIFGVDVLKNLNSIIYLSSFIILTIILGSFLALHQENLKKRLAYSTISQLGYILLGIILLNKNGLTGSILHLINHAFIKIVLFFCAGAIYYSFGIKNIREMKGIGKKSPIIMWCFTIAVISLIGLPPTNGFISKWYLALGGLEVNKLLFVVVLLLSSFLTAGYLLPIVITAFFSKDENIDIGVKSNLPAKMLVPIIILTVCIVFLGLFPNIVLNYIESIVFNIS